MHYYLDGYNLLFRAVRGGDNVTKRRQELIADLHNKISLVGLNVSLVFDSKYFPGGSEKSNFDNLEIIFSSVGETADELILDALQAAPDPRKETVVTSDKKLAWYARLKGAKTVTVEEFIDLLNRRYRNKKAEKPTKSELKKSLSAPVVLKPQVKIEDGSMEYYLQSFEEEFKKIEAEMPKKAAKEEKPVKSIRSRKKKFEKPEDEETQGLSEIDRWLKLFEKKLAKNGIED